MKAGTRAIRTNVASTIAASVKPTPDIGLKDTWAGIKAANEIDISTAAVVTTRPMPAMPGAVLSSLVARTVAAPGSSRRGIRLPARRWWLIGPLEGYATTDVGQDSAVQSGQLRCIDAVLQHNHEWEVR